MTRTQIIIAAAIAVPAFLAIGAGFGVWLLFFFV